MVRRGAAHILLLILVLVAGLSPAAAQVGYAVRSDGPSPSQDDILYSIDLRTGLATKIGSAVGFEDVESLTFSPGCQTLYGVDDETDQLVTCDTTSGTCTSVGPLGVNITDTGLAFGADGALYMSTDAPKRPWSFFQLDPHTGAATRIGDPGQEVTGLAGNRDGIWGLGGDGASNLVRISTETGHATPVGPLRNVMLVDGGLEFDSAGTLWGIHDGSVGRVGHAQSFTIDLTSGQATVVADVRDASTGAFLDGFEGLAIEQGICRNLLPPPPPPPPPSSIDPTQIPALGSLGYAALVLALGAAGLLALRRRRA
jgi:hypothetical protein